MYTALFSNRSSRRCARSSQVDPRVGERLASVPELDIAICDIKSPALTSQSVISNRGILRFQIGTSSYLSPRAVPHALRRPPQPLAQQLREHAMQDRERPRRALEARGVELERRRRLGGDDRRRARQLDHHAHLADDLARPEVREHDPLGVAAPLPLDADLAFEDEVDRRRWLALRHQRLAVLELAHRPETDEEDERALIERSEVRAGAQGLQDLRLVQLVGSDCPTLASVARSRSLRRRAMTRWRIG